MVSVMEQVHEYEKCHCVRPKVPDRKVRFMDMVPTDFVGDDCGVEPKGSSTFSPLSSRATSA